MSAIHLWGRLGKGSLQKQVDSNIVTLKLHKIPVQCSVRKLTLHQLSIDSSICCLILRQIPRQEDHRLNRLT